MCILRISRSSLIMTILTVSKFYKNLVKWALTEMECSVGGTTTLDREWEYSKKDSCTKYWTLLKCLIIIIMKSNMYPYSESSLLYCTWNFCNATTYNVFSSWGWQRLSVPFIAIQNNLKTKIQCIYFMGFNLFHRQSYRPLNYRCLLVITWQTIFHK